MKPLFTAFALALLGLSLAVPASAQLRRPAPAAVQTTAVSLRPFFLAAGQSFTAKETFTSAFGQSFQPFWGGGLEVVLFHDRVYVDLTASRFKKVGQRVSRFNGQTFGLGIPLTVTETPLEVSAGYRFRAGKRVNPYAGAGFGSYSYKEVSDFADPSENVDTRHAGYLAMAGAEFRLHRWIGLSGDVQYTHVIGILGGGGVSQDANETDLGGVAARVKVIVGR